jgi:hypothetical protein
MHPYVRTGLVSMALLGALLIVTREQEGFAHGVVTPLAQPSFFPRPRSFPTSFPMPSPKGTSSGGGGEKAAKPVVDDNLKGTGSASDLYDQLPVGKMPWLNWMEGGTVPKTITEPVKDARIARFPGNNEAQAAATAQIADSMTHSRFGERFSPACFEEYRNRGGDDGGVSYPFGGGTMAMTWLGQQAQGGRPLLHTRLIEAGEVATLEAQALWINPAPSIRLISKGSLPLRLVESFPGGVRVYAGRDQGGPAGEEQLHYIVTLDPRSNRIGGKGISGTMAVGTRDSVHTQQCSYLHMVLPAKSSDTFVVTTPVVTKIKEPAKDAQTFRGARQDGTARVLRVNVSTNFLDKPVASVSAGWDGRGIPVSFTMSEEGE